MRSIDFKAVLTGVSRAAEVYGFVEAVNGLTGVERQFLAWQVEHVFYDLLALGPLYGQLSEVVRLVAHHDVEALGLLAHPVDIFLNVGGIDDEEVVVVLHLVDEQVVDRSAVFVAHHAVEDFAIGGVLDVVGEDVVHVAFRVGTADDDFAHVADVEHTAVVAHGQVLVGDVGVLNGHVVAGKGSHEGSQGQVFVVKTGFLNFHICGFELFDLVDKFLLQVALLDVFDEGCIVGGELSLVAAERLSDERFHLFEAQRGVVFEQGDALAHALHAVFLQFLCVGSDSAEHVLHLCII